MYGYIYITTNNKNGKKYIGKKRSETFIGNKYLGSGKLLLRSIKKYGEESFSVELVEECNSKEELNKQEKYWISFYKAQENKSFYNICKGGEAGPGGPRFKGHKHSKETRTKMSENRSGSKNSNYGNRWSQSAEIRQKHSQPKEENGMFGYHFSEEQKKVLSEKKRQCRWVSNETETKQIKSSDLDKYLALGYIKGRKLKSSSTTIESRPDNKSEI